MSNYFEVTKTNYCSSRTELSNKKIYIIHEIGIQLKTATHKKLNNWTNCQDFCLVDFPYIRSIEFPALHDQMRLAMAQNVHKWIVQRNVDKLAYYNVMSQSE